MDSQADRHEFRLLVERAHGGDPMAVGDLLESYRQYLRAIARRRIGAALNPRMDISDVVQQSMIDAHQSFGRFDSVDNAELKRWLRHILNCNISTAIRDHLYSKKRRMSAEVSLDSTDTDGSMRFQPAANGESPSLELARIEESLRLLDHLQQIPPDQAIAVRMRYLERHSIDEIADELGRSTTAAAGLVKRGLQKLRKRISEKPA